ncbi:inositol monophosphatase [bacterium]|nr:inositol monophosphatase [bacterium]
MKEKSRPADFVTTADLKAEEAVLKILKKYFPNYNIYSEEEGKTDNGSEYTFVIDPLDGSNNFVIGIPMFSSNIALLKNDEVIFAVVYDPITGNLFYAIKDKGAFLNNKEISINNVSDIKQASISLFCAYSIDRNKYNKIFGDLYHLDVKRVLANWSPALEFCLLASGKIESMISIDNEIYDFIGGKLIATEAGAMVTDLQGQPEVDDKNNNFVISNNKKIHNQILKILK